MGRRGLEEHRAILTAIQEGDVATGERIMREHLSRTADRLCLDDEPGGRGTQSLGTPAVGAGQ
jgi:DNA-binding FadR family transcriptional regulator